MPIAPPARLIGILPARFQEKALEFVQRPTNRAALSIFAIRVGAAGLALVLQVVLARWLLQFEYGVFAVVWSWLLLFGRLSGLGFRTSIIRFIHMYQEAGDDDRLRGVIRGSRMVGAGLALILGATAASLVWLLQDQLGNFYALPVILAATALPAFALCDIHEGIGRAKGWILPGFLPHYIFRPVLFLALCGLSIVFGAPASALTAVMCLVIASYTVAALQFVKIERNLSRTIEKGPGTFALKGALLVTLPIFVVEAFYELLTTSDVLIVGLLLDPESVAVYFAAAKIIAPLHFVLFAIAAAFAPRFAQAYAAGETERLEGILHKAVRLAFWPTLLLFLVILALGSVLLGFFGEAFREGHILLAILGCGILARASMGPCESLLSMSGNQTDAAKVYAGAFAGNILLNLTLIPLFGLTGAAAATALAQIGEAAFLSRAVRKRFGVKAFVLRR